MTFAQAALGAEVHGLDLRQLDDATFKRIHEAWLQHVLMVFKEQTLTAEDLAALMAYLRSLPPLPEEPR